jgi:DNA-binding response OmpR family regulator
MPSEHPQPDEPVHLLLVRGGQLGAVRGLLDRLGVSVEELSAHPDAPGPHAEAVLRIGALVIDRAAHEVWLGGRCVECTPTEFALLAHLAERPGQVLSRRQLLDRLRGSADFVTARTIDSHIGNLRRKLAQDPDDEPLLVTVYGVGYRLRAARRRLEALPAQPAELRSGINGG